MGLEDPRGRLFLEYIRIVREKQPKFFVIENVKGILAEQHKEALDGILRQLKSVGYHVIYELLNAADYKIPQDRFRVFFVGIRKDLKNKYEFPNPTCTTPVTLRMAISDIKEHPRYFDTEPVTSENEQRNNHDVYAGAFDLKYMSRNRVRSWEETSFTIQAQARNTPLHPQAPKMMYVSPAHREFAKGKEELYRRLSVRECARIQTFPDSFRFIYTNILDGYKMVGNAVPPRLAWNLAIQMKKAFSSEGETEHVLPSTSAINPQQSELVAEIPKAYKGLIISNIGCERKNLTNASKSVLVGLVKTDNQQPFVNQRARFYYTGKMFPSAIPLQGLFYFMPYIKGKGIRDLYFIKAVRIGTKEEVVHDCHDKSPRIILELEFTQQFFPNYLPIHLNIWRTFCHYTLSELNTMKKLEEP